MATNDGRRFTLDEARDLLPTVKAITAEAVREMDALAEELRDLDEGDAERERTTTRMREIAEAWASRLADMGLEAKGLWLVDFDNGEGYYCWRYPEETVAHYHGYDDGFAGRMKIV